MFFKKGTTVTWMLCDNVEDIVGHGRPCTKSEIVRLLTGPKASPNTIAGYALGLKSVFSEKEFEEIMTDIGKVIGLNDHGVKMVSSGKAGSLEKMVDQRRFKAFAKKSSKRENAANEKRAKRREESAKKRATLKAKVK